MVLGQDGRKMSPICGEIIREYSWDRHKLMYDYENIWIYVKVSGSTFFLGKYHLNVSADYRDVDILDDLGGQPRESK